MLKKYAAMTDVSVNVVLTNGTNKHVSFSPKTGGGSTFITDDAELQTALENHYKFGTLFYIKEEIKPEPTPLKAKKAPAKADEIPVIPDDEEEPIKDETADNVIVVTDLDDARDIICEKFGISRTKVRKLEQIKAVAAEHNIILKGI